MSEGAFSVGDRVYANVFPDVVGWRGLVVVESIVPDGTYLVRLDRGKCSVAIEASDLFATKIDAKIARARRDVDALQAKAMRLRRAVDVQNNIILATETRLQKLLSKQKGV